MGHNSNSIEVEKKFWVFDYKPLYKWLEKNAKFKHSHRQIDEYFTPAHSDYLDKKYPDEFFRIRYEDNKYSITYKHWHEWQPEGQHNYCDEYETAIDNGDQFRKIALAMGFTPRILVDKIRDSYEYKNFEIDIDKIKDLGTFCEIEIQGKYLRIDDAIKQIRDLAKSIGIADSDGGPDMTGGYAMMIFRKQNKIELS